MTSKQHYKMIHSFLRRCLNAGKHGYLDNVPIGGRPRTYIAAQQAVKATGRQPASRRDHLLVYPQNYRAPAVRASRRDRLLAYPQNYR